MTATLNGKRRKHADALRAPSATAQARFIESIRKGQITTGADAAERFGVSAATIWNWVAKARERGYKIATMTGGAWILLGGPK